MASVKGVFLFPKCVLQECHFRWYFSNSQSIGKLQWPPSWHVDHWKSLFPMNLWAGMVFRGLLSDVTTLECQATRRWGYHQDPLLWWVSGNPASGSESPAVTAARLTSHFHRAWFMGRAGMQAYFLRSHQAVGLPAHRKVQRLGIGLAFSVYGLFLAINLEWEGRVIAYCWGAEWGAGGGEGTRATPWKGNMQPVLPQGHLASAAKKKKKKKPWIFSFATLLCHCKHRFDKVLAKIKSFLFFGFFSKMPRCLWGDLSNEA